MTIRTCVVDTCVECGGRYDHTYNVCPWCGLVNESNKQKINNVNEIPELIKTVGKLLEKESAIRLQIVSQKSKLEKLTNINSDKSGYVSIEVNKKKVKVTESSFRILMQEEINLLQEKLSVAEEALIKFNKNFE